jgi:hypothetical protein
MSAKQKREGILFGTVDILAPLIVKFGESCGVSIRLINMSICGPTYRFMELKSRSTRNPFGLVEIQQLPNERVLITLKPERLFPHGAPMTPGQCKAFDKFVTALMGRLVELGFVPLPEKKENEDTKRPIGFLP